MVARVRLAGLALNPIPEALRARSVGEDEEVFVTVFRDLFLNGDSRFGIRD